jgi:TrmH family RNA methyltransferase
MLSKAKLKYIKSLQLKKYRKEEQRFLVEGAKSVGEVIGSAFEIDFIVATPEYIKQRAEVLNIRRTEVLEASEDDLASAGTLQTNHDAIAVVRMKPDTPPEPQPSGFLLALDDIRDPGNLGTIIRTADWYGIPHIVASEETADFYNPKTIISSMGSFTRVNVFYTDLAAFLKTQENVYGAFLNGEHVHDVAFQAGGCIVMGNESNGISPEVEKIVRHRISIPRYGNAESLNVAIATAIILDNVRRGG